MPAHAEPVEQLDSLVSDTPSDGGGSSSFSVELLPPIHAPSRPSSMTGLLDFGAARSPEIKELSLPVCFQPMREPVQREVGQLLLFA